MSPQRWVLFALVVAGAALFHLVKIFLPDAGRDALANFSPFMALAVCGGLLFPRLWMAIVPLLILALADLVDPRGSLPLGFAVMKYGAFALAIGVGFRLRGKLGILGSFATVASCGIAFYLIANTSAWLATPAYAKTLAGWWQAQSTGLPGFPPSWIFLRNQLAGDLGFTALVLAVYGILRPHRSAAKSPAETVSA